MEDRIIPIDLSIVQSEFDINIERGFDLIQKALYELMPDDKIKKFGGIIDYENILTLEPCVFKVKCIGVVREVVGYSVTGWTSIPATQYEPEDIDITTLGEYRTIEEAAKCFVENMFKLKSNKYWESIRLEELADWMIN